MCQPTIEVAESHPGEFIERDGQFFYIEIDHPDIGPFSTIDEGEIAVFGMTSNDYWSAMG